MEEILESNLEEDLKENPTPDLEPETLRKLAEGDLYVFAKGILNFDWLQPEIHKPLCRLLELYEGCNPTLRASREDYLEVLQDRHTRLPADRTVEELLNEGVVRLQVVLPRGWLKTTLVSIAYPLWRAVRNPSFRSLLTQNTYKNAAAKNSTIKSQVEKNKLFRSLWPGILPSRNSKWSIDSLCLERETGWPESTFEAAGTRTQVTSRHYDLIIEDDTVAPDKDDLGEQAAIPKKDDIEQAIGYHKLVPPLLVNPTTSQSLVVGTRWCELDLISWQRENQRGLVVYERSCLENTEGKSDESGEPTYLERFPSKTLDDLKSLLGPYTFSCLYLNKPIRSNDMVFQPDWFRYYEDPPKDLICYSTVDIGNDPEDTKGDPDPSVVMTCGKHLKSGLVYVLDYTRLKGSPGELIDAIFEHVRKYHPVKVGIESVQYQRSLKYWVRERQRSENLWFCIEGIEHNTKSKQSRIMGLQPVISNGGLRFRVHQTALVNELLAFPIGAHDDMADALSMQLGLWSLTSSSREIEEKTFAKDPMSVSSAIEELEAKYVDVEKEKRGRNPVLDIYSQFQFNPVFGSKRSMWN